MVDRGDVIPTRRCLAMVILVTSSLLLPLGARADQPCDVVPMPCTFEGVPFKFNVVDVQTRQPLADVHALAEWQIVGLAGRADGPLMALDAVSGPDGVLSFPGWGPAQGPVYGLEIGRDPVVTLFKTGYKALNIYNGDPLGTKETQRVRRFYQDGRTYAFEPFRGTPEQWLEQLDKILGLPRSDEQSLRFRVVYL